MKIRIVEWIGFFIVIVGLLLLNFTDNMRIADMVMGIGIGSTVTAFFIRVVILKEKRKNI